MVFLVFLAFDGMGRETHLLETAAQVRAEQPAGPLDVELDEGEPDVLLLLGRGVGTERVDDGLAQLLVSA